MGRGKLKMVLMEKKKSRMLTFKKRKEGLTKKLQELMTLRRRRLHDHLRPRSKTTSIWPPPELPHELIDAYKRDSAAGKVKFHGVSDYFAEKRREVEEERKNLKGKYPVWEEWLSLMSESELRDFGDALQSKAHFVRSRIQFLKYCASATDFTPLFHFQDSFINPAAATATGFDMVDYNSAAAVDFYAPPQYPYMPCSSSSSMENHQSLNYWPLNACDDDITHYISFE